MDDPPDTDPCCCGAQQDRSQAPPAVADARSELAGLPWVDGFVSTPAGEVPRVSSSLTGSDRRGSWKARWGIRRMQYVVEPGLYAVGNPTAESPVLVSANYKMSFDRLRSQLDNRDAWVLVLNTQGINVWCAAGKGTFGTDELVDRVEAARLREVVDHRQLVVPQLGAPGVAAHEAKKACGFRVIFGPVQAEDLPAFLDAGMQATPDMRRVRFPFRDRVALIPVELVMGAKFALVVAACMLLLAGLGPGIYSVERAWSVGLPSAALFLAVCAAGVSLTPALLPWLPGRAFATKGAFVGLGMAMIVGAWAWARPGVLGSGVTLAAWLLMILAVASFAGMNFTGASTYTSLSGVRREMRVAVPMQAVCAVLGAGLWLVGRFV